MQNSGYTEKITYEWRCRQTKGGKLPASRINASSLVHNNALYLVGGNGAGVGRSNEVWRYDIKEGLWQLVVNKGHDNPPCRDGHSCTLIEGGCFLLFGGQNAPTHNDKSERNTDIVRSKTYLIRDLFNDLYKFDCEQEMWTMMCPEGGVPLCRRGHSAVYVPAGTYTTLVSPPHGDHNHSPKKKTPSKKGLEEDNPFSPIPENSLVVFGGAGMEVSKYIEAVYNDIWVYNISIDRWSRRRTRGIDPKPLFNHRAERVGELMVVVGGITSTNAKPFISDLPAQTSQDVLILNLRTLTWSYLDLLSRLGGSPPRLNLHGHSLCPDPADPSNGILFIFGGKDTIDGRHAAQESIAGGKKLMRRTRATGCWTLDIKSGALNLLEATGQMPENRYEHVGAALLMPSTDLSELPALKQSATGTAPASRREVGVMVIFGGSRVEQEIGGYCSNTIHELVRVHNYTAHRIRNRYEDDDATAKTALSEMDGGQSVHSQHSRHSTGHSLAASQFSKGGSVGQRDAQLSEGRKAMPHNHTSHTSHTSHTQELHAHDSEIYSHHDRHGGDEGDEKEPSIWQKVQAQMKATGQPSREPSTWPEIKLSLSNSLTEKRTHATAPAAAPAAAQSNNSALQGSGNSLFLQSQSKILSPATRSASSLVPELKGESIVGPEEPAAVAPGNEELYRALEAKRRKQRIKTMSDSQVLPLVAGKHLSFIAAKETFLKQFPPHVPPTASPIAAVNAVSSVVSLSRGPSKMA